MVCGKAPAISIEDDQTISNLWLSPVSGDRLIRASFDRDSQKPFAEPNIISLPDWSSINKDNSDLRVINDTLVVSCDEFEGFVVPFTPPFDGSFKLNAIWYGDDASFYAREEGYSDRNFPEQVLFEGFDRFGADNTEGEIYDISVLNGKWVYQDEVTVENDTVSGYVHSLRQEGEGVRNRNINDWLLNTSVVYLKNERYYVYFKAPVLYREAFDSSTRQTIPIKDGHRVYKLRRLQVEKNYSNNLINFSHGDDLTYDDVKFIESNPWAVVPIQIKDYLGFEVSDEIDATKVERVGWDGTNLYVQAAGQLHGLAETNSRVARERMITTKITFVPNEGSDLSGYDSFHITNFGDFDGRYIWSEDDNYFEGVESHFNDDFNDGTLARPSYYYVIKKSEREDASKGYWCIFKIRPDPLGGKHVIMLVFGSRAENFRETGFFRDLAPAWDMKDYPNAHIEHKSLRIYEIIHQTQLQGINSNIRAYFSNLIDFTLPSIESSKAVMYRTVAADRFSSIKRLFFYIMTEGLGEKGKNDNVIDRATNSNLEQTIVNQSIVLETAQDVFTKTTTTINFFGPSNELMQMNLSVDGIGRHLDEPKGLLSLLIFLFSKQRLS